VRVHKAIWGMLFCLSGCGPIIEADFTPARYASYVPRPLQPNNCGTPDQYAQCPPRHGPRLAVAQTRTYVTIEEVGGAPVTASGDLPPEE
jgi:hypothetical protein